MSDDTVGVIFGPPPGWAPPTRWEVARNRISTALTCNWFAIALTCRVRGHRWRTQKPSRCVEVRTCEICGQLRGGRLHQGRWYRGPTEPTP